MNLVLVVLVVVASVLYRTAAETYTVGGQLNWRVPPNTTAYSTWAAAITFRVGDTLGELLFYTEEPLPLFILTIIPLK